MIQTRPFFYNNICSTKSKKNCRKNKKFERQGLVIPDDAKQPKPYTENMKKDAVKIFEDKKVRTVWDGEVEQWYFAIVDVVAALTNSPNPQVYWRVMKKRLKDEGNETVTNCNGLKLLAPDGKMRITDVADTEQLLGLNQI